MFSDDVKCEKKNTGTLLSHDCNLALSLSLIYMAAIKCPLFPCTILVPCPCLHEVGQTSASVTECVQPVSHPPTIVQILPDFSMNCMQILNSSLPWATILHAGEM